MELQKDYMLVKELTDDMIIDGLIEKYDDNSPFIHAKVVDAQEDITRKLCEKYNGKLSDVVVLFSRPNKIPYLGNLLVHEIDIIAIMSEEEYKNKIRGGN